MADCIDYNLTKKTCNDGMSKEKVPCYLIVVGFSYSHAMSVQDMSGSEEDVAWDCFHFLSRVPN